MTAPVLEASTPTIPAPPHRRRGGLAAGLVALTGLLLVACFFSITLGARSITLATIWHAFTGFDPASAAETVIWQMRLPRTLLGLAAGAALGAGGAVLQGVTRNPLADPGIMGINAGAAACIVAAIMVLGVQSPGAYVWLAFLGAGLATVAVYTIASFGREGATPVKLALAGAAVTAGLSSITSAIIMTRVEALNELRFWQVGSLAGRYLPVFWQTAPFMLLGLVVALGAGRALNGLALG
jgi:iron complex transport system permease protein